MNKIIFDDKYHLTERVLKGEVTQTRIIFPNKVFEQAKQRILEKTDHKVTYEEFHELVKAELLSFAPFQIGEVVAIAQSYQECCNQHDGYLERICHPRFGKDVEKQKGWTEKSEVLPELMPRQIQIVDIDYDRMCFARDEDYSKLGILQTQTFPSSIVEYKSHKDGLSRPIAQDAYEDYVRDLFGDEALVGEDKRGSFCHIIDFKILEYFHCS